MGKKTAIELTDAEMQEALEKKKQERILRCGEKIRVALEEENCDLTAETLLRNNQVLQNIIIVAK